MMVKRMTWGRIRWLVPAVVAGAVLSAPVGCSKKKSKDGKGKQGAPAPAMRAAPLAPAAGTRRRPSRRPPMAVARRPGMSPPTTPMGPPPARELGKGAFAPTVKKPRYGVFYKIARKPDVEDVKVWNIAPVGGARFATAVTARRKGAKRYDIRLLVVEQVAGKWQLVHNLLIDAPANSVPPAGGKVGASVKVRDYDRDGKREARLRYRYATGAKGNGETQKLALVSLDGKQARVAVVATLAENCAGCPTQESGYFKLRDLNKDGHPDLVVSRVSKTAAPAGAKATASKTDEHYLWAWKTDGWLPKGAKPGVKVTKLPASMRIGYRRITMDCLELKCFDLRGFPAVSADGKLFVGVASYLLFSSWLGAGEPLPDAGVVIHVVRVSDGKLLQSAELLTDGDHGGAYQMTQDQRCIREVDKSGQGDQRLCEQQEKRYPAAVASLKSGFRKVIAKLAAELGGQRFGPLGELPEVDPKRPLTGTGLATRVTIKDSTVTVELLKWPGKQVLAKGSYAMKAGNIIATAFVDARRRRVILRMMAFDDPTSGMQWRFASLALPAGAPTSAATVPPKPAMSAK